MTEHHTPSNRNRAMDRTIPVLYVEMNEDGTTGGSHVVIADIITRVPPPYRPVVLFYQDNPMADKIRRLGIEVVTWDTERDMERRLMEQASRIGKVGVVANQIRRRWRFLRERGIHLVHLGNSPLTGCDDWLPASILARVPRVAYSMGGADAHVDVVRKHLVRYYDRILPNSRYLAKSIESLGYPADRIVLTYPGLDLAARRSRSYRNCEEIRTEHAVIDEQLLVAMVGNIRRWKGQHVVVEALAALPASVRDRLRVLFIGTWAAEDEQYREELLEKIRSAGLESTVTLTDWRSDVPDILHAADIAVHASILPEPFGLVVLEAMAHRCAVIAADTGGPAEMLDQDSGILVDTSTPAALGQAIERLATDPALRLRLAGNATIRASRFDITHHVDTVVEVYRQLLGELTPSPADA